MHAGATIKVAQIWDEFMASGFVEVNPLFGKLGFPVSSITLTRTLWESGSAVPDGSVFFHRRKSRTELRESSLWFRARSYVERRFLRFPFLRFAESVIDRHQAQVLHFNFGFTAAQYPELTQRAPFVVTFYGSDVSSALRNPYWRSRYQAVLPRAAALLVLCEEARERLVELGCPRERVHVWNLPAGVEAYPLRPQPAWQLGRPFRFITTARFVEKKGHGLLLEALSLLRAKGLAFEVTLLGYSKGIHWVREEIARRELGKCVRVIDTEFCENFAALHHSLLREQDFFVMPSVMAKNGDDEGGPALSMVCAQAAGLPVVCTRFPGAEITLDLGKSGIYADAASAQGLAAAIERMLEERASWERMGLEGRRLALANFGEREQVEKLISIYRQVLEERA